MIFYSEDLRLELSEENSDVKLDISKGEKRVVHTLTLSEYERLMFNMNLFNKSINNKKQDNEGQID